jgi:hypothetical protein
MSVQDHLLAVIKAGLIGVPAAAVPGGLPTGLAGAIASLIGDYVPKSGQKAVERAIGMFAERVRQLESRMDPDAIDKDEFAELFMSCARVIVRSRTEQKLRAAANLLALGLIRQSDPGRLTYTELDHFVRCLDSLSLGALEALGHVSRYAAQRRRPRAAPDLERMDFRDVRAAMPKVDPHLLMGLLGELAAMNLVLLDGGPSIRQPDYANYPVEFTPLGRRFVEFVLEPGRRPPG